ncbi:MAG: hypothetical protein PHS98_04895 [Bacilli bacterium]|nr:hypothetical protein [Bacilli bacterium]
MNDAEIRLKVDIDGDKANTSLGKLSNVGAKVGKAIAAGTVVAGTALTALVGKSVAAAGELEQQIGGTEAVFGEFATKVQDMSKTAFSSAGLSANQYMATMNKMGSLMQGSGIEQQKAMDLSSQAMQRAADVASIMGIDVNSAMESIAGAAKGNYTMMDNLGVAMSDTSIESYALSKGIKKSYSEMSKGEKVQLAMEMFLEKSAYATGNYAKENKTFAGSMQTMKASFENFMSGAGSVDDLIESVVSFGKILVTKITEMTPQIISGIIQLLNAILPQIPILLQQLLPGVMDGVIGLIQGIINMLPTIITMLAGMLPTLITSLIEGLVLIIQALAEMMPELIPTIIDAILSIIPILIDNLPLFIKAGWQLITGLLEGIIRSVPTLLSYIPKIISSLFNYFKQMPSMMLDIGKNLIKGLWNGIKNVKDWLFKKIGDFAGGILSKVKGIFGIHSPSKEFAIIGKYNVEGLEEGIEGESKNLDKTLDLNLGSSLDYVANMGLGKYNPAIGSGRGSYATLNIAMGDINMDGNKVGRAVTPYVTKTVKLSGGNV